MSHVLVVAVGGNALLPAVAATGEMQGRRIAGAAEAIAELARGQPTVVTHGNGPQIGLLVRRESALAPSERVTLDVLGAQTAGHLGYLLGQELARLLGQDRVGVLLTRVAVSPADASFARPTKPIGPAGAHRRLVASPEPVEIVDLEAIRALLAAGMTVVCLGGGGIPVVRKGAAARGAEAVIDKDLSTARLAGDLGSQALVILTDVDAVYRDFGTPSARRIRSGGVTPMRALDLPAGSMGPKVEALCRFVDGGGRFAACGAIEQAGDVLRGMAGTRVLPDPAPLVMDQGPT